jgi:hypothetical protein
MKQSGKTPLPRRRFLQQLMVLGGATGAGAMALNATRTAAAPTQAADAKGATVSKGYRLTEHIRTYYEKAQI